MSFAINRRVVLASAVTIFSGAASGSEPGSPKVTRPRATDGDQKSQPNWDEHLTISVGNRGADINGSDDRAILDHGTGHGIGLEVHEPPLLDWKGVQLLPGDVVTVEPGLYKAGVGGIRVEDIVAVTDEGCENLNTLPEGLDWK